MRSPLQTPFAAVFQYEIILNTKRVAPYAMIVVFTANSILWWGWSAAATSGWATNNDYNIVRNIGGFAFALGLPLFNALIMGDPVNRDFDTGIDPLIFSKPISRASYLLAKFAANFFVLVCCQSAFMWTMIVMQWFPATGLVTFPPRLFPFFQHFFMFVVMPHLFLAAVFFTLATLKRNAKFAYGAAVAFYPLYISYQLLFLKHQSPTLRALLDPMGHLSAFQIPREKWKDPRWVDALVIEYGTWMIVNRVLFFVLALALLAFLYRRFVIAEERREWFPRLNLASLDSRVFVRPDSAAAIALPGDRWEGEAEGRARQKKSVPKRGSFGSKSSEVLQLDLETIASRSSVPIPEVSVINQGLRANLRKLFAATMLELNLIRHERSLMLLVPLAAFISFLSLPFSVTGSGAATATLSSTGLSSAASPLAPSASIIFASATARGVLLFLLGVIVFYIGEAMHRDREARFEPILWSTPASNSALLLSKFFAILALCILLMVLIALTAMLTQLLRGQTPINPLAYLLVPLDYVVVYSVILIPSLAFMAAASMSLNVLLREKYLSYAITIAVGSALFYLYTQGHTHWLYNPVIYGLWTETDFTSWSSFSPLLGLRAYALALTTICLVLTKFCFSRKGNQW